MKNDGYLVSSETIRLKSSILEDSWVSGFTDGEGCFYIGVYERSDTASGFQVLPEFVIVQHENDIQILYKLKEFFGCGKVVTNHKSRKAFRVRKLSHLREIIIPFFWKNRLHTKKWLDFLSFRKVVDVVMLRDEHLTVEGIKKIFLIKKRMNRGRLRHSPTVSEME